MLRSRAADPEVLDRGDQAAPEEAGPGPVHRDPRGERVRGRHQPTREAESVPARSVGEPPEDLGDVRRQDLSFGMVVLPTAQEARLPGHLSVTEHHGRGDLVPLEPRSISPRAREAAPHPGRLPVERRQEEAHAALRRGPLPGQREDLSAPEDPPVHPEVADLARQVPGVAAGPDAQRLLGREGPVESVDLGLEASLHAVDEHGDARCLARAVIGHRHVVPRALHQGLLAHDLDGVAVPVVDQVHGRTHALQEHEVHPAVAVRVLHAAEHGAVGVRPQPEGHRERSVLLELHGPAQVRRIGAGAVEDERALHLQQRRLPGLASALRHTLTLRPEGSVTVRGALLELQERPLEPGDLRCERVETSLLFGGGHAQDRRHVAPDLRVDALLVHLIEEAEEAVVVHLGDGVVAVIMAPSAGHGQPEEGGRAGLRAVGHVLHAPLLVDRPRLGDRAVVALEPGGEHRVAPAALDQVPRHLLHDEAVVGHVRGEGAQDPVAPRPLVPTEVVLVAVGVGVAREVEPLAGPMLGAGVAGQQPVHHLGVRHLAREERVQLLEGRRQAREVEVHASQPGRRGRRR